MTQLTNPDYADLLNWVSQQQALNSWHQQLPRQISQGLDIQRWGDLPQWQQVLADLPDIAVSGCDFTSGARIGLPDDCDDLTREQLQKILMGLHPWRKGPFTLFGLAIDTEWRSDWKWQRLKPQLPKLQGKTVLDVGCGNGYHCLRLYGEGAKRVIGIDPSAKFVHQFYALKKYCPKVPVDVLPLGIEHIPPALHAFDLVLSMGVIYHRRDPVEHIRELAGCLKSGGTLVLETLIIDDEAGQSLMPEGRYAKMRNVWCIPSPTLAMKWLLEAGLENVQCVDLSTTTTEEQRSTPWMTFESLPDFLNPNDSSKTIEGHPAPRRGIFIATTP